MENEKIVWFVDDVSLKCNKKGEYYTHLGLESGKGNEKKRSIAIMKMEEMEKVAELFRLVANNKK